jgi:hypothetical protein
MKFHQRTEDSLAPIFNVPELFVDRGNGAPVETDGIFNICSNINEQEQRRGERHPNFPVPNNYLLLFWQCI